MTYWVITRHTKDRAGPFTLREHTLTGPMPQARDFLTLEDARAALPLGVAEKLPVYPEDDPVIVEVWI